MPSVTLVSTAFCRTAEDSMSMLNNCHLLSGGFLVINFLIPQNLSACIVPDIVLGSEPEGKNKRNKTKKPRKPLICALKELKVLCERSKPIIPILQGLLLKTILWQGKYTQYTIESECMAGRMTLAISNRNTTKSDLNKTATCYLTKQEVQRCHSGTCEFGGSSRREVPFLPPFCHSQCWHCLPDDLKMQSAPVRVPLPCFHFTNLHPSAAVFSGPITQALRQSLAQQQETWEWLQPAPFKHIALKKREHKSNENGEKWLSLENL